MMLSVFNFRGLLATLIAVFAFSGCTADELEMISSFEKLQKTNTYVSETKVSFEFNYWGGDEYFKDSMSRVKAIADAAEFTIINKFEGDAEKQKFKAHVNGEISIDPVTVDGMAWIDMDTSANTPKYQVIVTIPAIAKALLPEEYRKDYLFIDYVDLMSVSSQEYGMYDNDFVSYTSQLGNIQRQFSDVLAIAKELQSISGIFDVSVAEKDGAKTLTVKVTDAQLKKFILALLNGAKTDEAMLDKLVEITEMYSMLLFPMNDYYYTKDEMKELFQEELEDSIPEIEEYFNNNALLGSRGLTYELTLDKEGNIAGQKLVLCINPASNVMLNPYSYYFDDEPGQSAELTITADTVYSSVNKMINIGVPVLNANNSVNLSETMRKSAIEEAEARKWNFPSVFYYSDTLSKLEDETAELPLKGEYNGKEINTTVKVLYWDHEFYIPIRQAAEIFGGEVEWIPEQRVIRWFDGDITYADYNIDEYIRSDNSQPSFDDEWMTAYLIDGTLYYPLSELQDMFDAEFGYDRDTDTILIR